MSTPEWPNPRQLWDEDETFGRVFSEIIGHSLVDKARCFMLYQFANQVSRLAGAVAEVGVYKGGTARLLARVLENADKTIHLFDTFSGMPPVDPEKDHHREGDFSDTTLESVKALLSDRRNIEFHPGLFPGTADPVAGETFCLVHVDVDIYKSTMDCCEFFYPRMTTGGIIVFDDYGFISCPGAKVAVDQFFANRQECPCYLPTGQCFVFKL